MASETTGRATCELGRTRKDDARHSDDQHHAGQLNACPTLAVCMMPLWWLLMWGQTRAAKGARFPQPLPAGDEPDSGRRVQAEGTAAAFPQRVPSRPDTGCAHALVWPREERASSPRRARTSLRPTTPWGRSALA